MQVTYDPKGDTLRILLCNAPIQESETIRSGLILDYDHTGKIIGMELAHASAHISLPYQIEVFKYAATDAVPKNMEPE